MRIVVFVGAALASLVACGSDDNSVFQGPDAGVDADSGDATMGCLATQQMCGTSCVDTTTDTQNCGACGNACQSGDLCCSAKCVKSASCSFAVTKVDPIQGNQNGGDWLHLTGSGFTSDMSVYIADGRAPVLVLDAQHATIQTPPDTVGTYDVTIQNGSGSSITRKAFHYQSGPVMPPWKDVPMPVVRGEHPAVTPLQDGRVLIAGGTTVPDDPAMSLASGILLTRSGSDGTVAPTANNMGVPRWRDAATTMLDGRALVVGGATCTGTDCKTGDLYPMANAFTPSKALMAEDRTFVWSVLMVDGRVMITSSASTTVEVYDPKADSFSTLPLSGAHNFGQRIVRLRDGRVMVLGGDGGQTIVDVYDPSSGKFAAVAPLKQGRSEFTAHVLPDGRVMVFGGASISAGGVHVPLDEIEAYDPSADTWTVMPYKLSTGRTWHASALVRDGTVLVMGGYNVDTTCAVTNTVDVVDPVKGTVSPFATLTNGNTEWNAVTMLDGSVVGVGGGACGTTQAFPDIYFLPGGPPAN